MPPSVADMIVDFKLFVIIEFSSFFLFVKKGNIRSAGMKYDGINLEEKLCDRYDYIKHIDFGRDGYLEGLMNNHFSSIYFKKN